MDCYEVATSAQQQQGIEKPLKTLNEQRRNSSGSSSSSSSITNTNTTQQTIGGNGSGSGTGGSNIDANKFINDDLDLSIRQLLESSGGVGGVVGNAAAPVKLRKQNVDLNGTGGGGSSSSGGAVVAGHSQSYRISMANLEGTHESELDQILGELSFLEEQMANLQMANLQQQQQQQQKQQQQQQNNNTPAQTQSTISAAAPSLVSAGSPRTHSRTNSTISGATTLSSYETSSSCSSSGFSEAGACQLSYNRTPNALSQQQQQPAQHQQQQQLLARNHGGIAGEPELRTESPDNDSAFSDTVSLLSCESSASSSVSAAMYHQKQQELQAKIQQQQQQLLQMQYAQQQQNSNGQQNSKEAKIQLALHKLENAPVRRLFVKAFTNDGASKSLLVDEYMCCGQVTRLLAGKNHVQMQPNWALVENLGDLQMERIFEDHELLVDNLMAWHSDGNNSVLFQQRDEKYALFAKPEIYFPGPQMAPGCQHDEHTRAMLVEDFFKSNSQLQVEGPLYFKSDAKKAWKRYHFVLRNSGLYYFPKEKTKNVRDLVCLTQFKGYNIYAGVGWKKKWKSPTDFTFSFKAAHESSAEKACRSLKMLCAEDQMSLQKWMTAVRISKYGNDLWHNYKTLLKDLCLAEGLNHNNKSSTHNYTATYMSVRSNSINSIASAVPSQCGSISSAISSLSNQSKERISRGSSSSSSGFLSDDNNAFDSEFTTGTIKRKPSMKPNLPLTTITRQLKEVGEITISQNETISQNDTVDGKGTLTSCRRNRRKSLDSNGSSTLKQLKNTEAVADAVKAEMPAPTAVVLCTTQPGMSASTLSLDSLPPPPPPPPLELDNEHDIYGSQMSLPPPPPLPMPPMPEERPEESLNQQQTNTAITIKANNKPVPPYKSPPNYVYPMNECKKPPAALPPALSAESAYVNSVPMQQQQSQQPQQQQQPMNPTTQKKVSFANPPVLLNSSRMCSTVEQTTTNYNHAFQQPTVSNDMMLSSSYRYSNIVGVGGVVNNPTTTPKNLKDSASNPPREFLKDLQRVMRRKWQVAQKCKLEPSTTPHEVLGFRDFNNDDLLATHNLYSSDNSSSHYYRETANVSNWVQEHYGALSVTATVTATANTNAITTTATTTADGYALYENVYGVNKQLHDLTSTQAPPLPPPAAVQLRKKRPPPPPPKRSDSTHLTHRA